MVPGKFSVVMIEFYKNFEKVVTYFTSSIDTIDTHNNRKGGIV